MTPPVALTIAGSDSGGGAGIQADLKTFAALGVYGTSAITAITAQNTQGVTAVQAIAPDIVAAQIDAVLSDMRVAAIKTGMVFSAGIIDAIADTLAKHPGIPLIVDPVMVATSGDRLIDGTASAAMVRRLFPLSACITPNLAEAAALTDTPIATTEAEMQRQGAMLLDTGAKSVLIKGGHGTTADSVDILVRPGEITRYRAPRVATNNTHGTGCTLSAAIAARLAAGLTLVDAIASAKAYLTDAIIAAKDQKIGKGHGPVDHFHAHTKA